MRLARAVPIALPVVAVAALFAGCGSSSSEKSSSQTQPPPTAKTSTVPVGASTQSCKANVAGTEQLRLAGVECDVGRVLARNWSEKPSCSTPSRASRYSCAIKGYRCLGTRTDAGIAVSCSRPGLSASFIAKRG